MAAVRRERAASNAMLMSTESLSGPLRDHSMQTAETTEMERAPVVAPLSDRAVMVPPLNFAMVAPGVYRSGYPNKKNFPFLSKLGLKSIMYLAKEDFSDDSLKYFADNNIQVFHHRLTGNKEPFSEIGEEDIAQALNTVLDKRNHPILLHCNKGKHRVGCLVGCLRKLQHWSLTSIFDEYQRFAGKAVRIADTQFIELFDETKVKYDAQHKPSFI